MHEFHAAILKRGCEALGLQQDIQLIGVHGNKWVLDYEQSSLHPDFAENMIRLERWIQASSGRPIDLRLEAKEDKMNRKKRNILYDAKNNVDSK